MRHQFAGNLADPNVVYLDTEFTNFRNPELLSIGMVSREGDEFYRQVGLNTAEGRRLAAASSQFVREEDVLPQWGVMLENSVSIATMASDAAAWLLVQAKRCAEPLEIAFDYGVDFELLTSLLKQDSNWHLLQDQLQPLNAGDPFCRLDGGLAADAAFTAMLRRGLRRHHALADAHALRAACFAIITGRYIRL